MTRTAGCRESRVGPFLGLSAAAALVAFVTLLAALLGRAPIMAAGPGPSRVAIQTLSTDASRVTGGDVLVQITVPPNAPEHSVKVTVAGRDVSDQFRTVSANTLMGLVTGLVNGKNTILVRTAGRSDPAASLEVTNYPITGPVTSGPWIQPFICQTDQFTLPDGTKLGAGAGQVAAPGQENSRETNN